MKTASSTHGIDQVIDHISWDAELLPHIFPTDSYSSAKATEMCPVHVGTPTVSSSRNDAPRLDLSAAMNTDVSMTIWNGFKWLSVNGGIIHGV